MIYLKLFLVFLKIGAVAFGGGYGMLSLIREDVLRNGWLTETELVDFIAISESTPGPIAVNMATFVGSSQAGVLGGMLATLGIILPAFLIMLMVAITLSKVLEKAAVKAVVSSIKPVVAGLIFGVALTLFMSLTYGITNIKSALNFDWKVIIILYFIIAIHLIYKKIRGKNISPLILILLSGILGLIFYL